MRELEKEMNTVAKWGSTYLAYAESWVLADGRSFTFLWRENAHQNILLKQIQVYFKYS